MNTLFLKYDFSFISVEKLETALGILYTVDKYWLNKNISNATNQASEEALLFRYHTISSISRSYHNIILLKKWE